MATKESENFPNATERTERIIKIFASEGIVLVDGNLLRTLTAFTSGYTISALEREINLAISLYQAERPKTCVVLTNIKSNQDVDGGTLYMVEARIEGTDIYRVGRTADEAMGRLVGDFTVEFNVGVRWGFATSEPYGR